MGKLSEHVMVSRDAWEAFVHLARAQQHLLAAWEVIARHDFSAPASAPDAPSTVAAAGGAADSERQIEPTQTRTEEQSPPAAAQSSTADSSSP